MQHMVTLHLYYMGVYFEFKTNYYKFNIKDLLNYFLNYVGKNITRLYLYKVDSPSRLMINLLRENSKKIIDYPIQLKRPRLNLDP